MFSETRTSPDFAKSIIGDEALEAVGQQNADPVAGLEAFREQGVAQPVGESVELAKADDAFPLHQARSIAEVQSGPTDQSPNLHDAFPNRDCAGQRRYKRRPKLPYLSTASPSELFDVGALER